MIIELTKKEIEEQMYLAADTSDNSKYPALSYEHGVEAALSWILGDNEAKPMED